MTSRSLVKFGHVNGRLELRSKASAVAAAEESSAHRRQEERQKQRQERKASLVNIEHLPPF
jgi:hypothetical protein